MLSLCSLAFLRHSLFLLTCIAFLCGLPSLCQAHDTQMTLLIPSKPSIDQPAIQPAKALEEKNKDKDKDKKDKDAPKEEASKTAAPEQKLADTSAQDIDHIVSAVNASILACAMPQAINEEVDLLISGMRLFRHQGIAMDMPRIFTIYRFDKEAAQPTRPAQREDRLGDIESISYLDQKAWGANVGLERSGLYQFSIETRPWWDASVGGYEQQIVKVMLPVYGEDWGWHVPLGLSFEIVPRIRPFGLMAPTYFAAQVLVNGKAAKDLPVEFRRINVEDFKVPTVWNEYMATRTNANGDFAIVLNEPGWWCCRTYMQGAPLKGPDGSNSPSTISSLFWLYIDAPRGHTLPKGKN